MTQRRFNQFVGVPTASGIASGVLTTLTFGDLWPYMPQLQFSSAAPAATVKIEVLGAANFWFTEVEALSLAGNPIWIPEHPVFNIRYTFADVEVLAVPDNRTGIVLELR